MENRETRTFAFEVRAEENEKHGTHITGMPVVFGQETDLGWIREVIDPGAMSQTDMKDVKFLVGHDTSMIPLARSRNNNENSTMQLSVSEKGLSIRADLDTENNADARTLYSAVKRGDISGMSFMFTVDKEDWEDLDSEKPLRRIMSIRKLFEVSAVAFPAYEETSLEAASEGEALESVKASLESAKKALQEDRERAAKRKSALESVLGSLESGARASKEATERRRATLKRLEEAARREKK